MKKYYLNNVTGKEIAISLTAKRKVKPFSSLSLNDKDVQLYKNLKHKRAGKPSLLDGLVLSTIKIENDARYASMKATNKSEKDANTKSNKSAKEKAAEEKAKKAEDKAKKELEEKAIAEEKEAIRKAFIEEYEKEGKNFAEDDLEKMVEEAFAKAHETDEQEKA